MPRQQTTPQLPLLIMATLMSGGLGGQAQTASPLPGNTGYTLSAQGIRVDIRASSGKSDGLHITDTLSSTKIDQPELFTIIMHDGTTLPSSHLQINGPFKLENVSAITNARVIAERSPGKRVCADFSAPPAPGLYHWCLLLRSEAHYFRQHLTITAGDSDLPISHVRLLDFQDPAAHLSGTVAGTPIINEGMFFGFEHPLSTSEVKDGHATASIARDLSLRAGQSITYSSVIGVAPKGQMRRAFLAYLEAERPRPYAPFLHYNSWYDLGFGNDYDETGALDRVQAFGTELAQKRHVKLDSYLFDDGWDNPNTLWGFNQGFPNGFTKVAAAANTYHAGIGVWLSPWGGYGKKKDARIAFGSKNNYEIINDGYALSGNRYYERFEQTCLDMIRRYGVNQFKIDGTGNADRVFPGSLFDSDFDAAIHLLEKVRQEKPAIYINLSTGTYASPFWLFYTDSIWRGGEDDDRAGVGSARQRWVTYRDQETYRNVVLGGSLFPLNSLMLHGLIFAQQAKDLASDPDGDFPSEIHSYFASGTQLQEMYVTPSLLNEADWDALAHAAKWARENSAILRDTHWVGGDPGKLEVYGWAAWSPKGWIITLRNPSDHPQSFTLDIKNALQLPDDAPSNYLTTDPFGKPGTSPEKISTQSTQTINLAPFEVKTIQSLKTK